MLRALILENFMAHGRTEITFGPGLTVLTGPNNVGKSAVVEALRCLTSNPAPRHHIRHGAREARVTAVLDDGVEVTWIRREKHALYEVRRPGAEKPEEYGKLGRKGAVPEEVAALLRLDPVEVEGRARPVDVHVGNQREPIFLLNESPAVMASLLAASTEAGHLLDMQKALAGRVRDEKKREKELAARISRLEVQLGALSPLPGLALRVERAEALFAEARAAGEALPRLEALCADMRRAAAGRDALAARLAPLSRLEPPARPEAVAGLAVWLEQRGRLAAAGERARARAAALSPLAAPPRLADTAGAAAALEGISRLRTARASGEARGAALAPLLAPPRLADTQGPELALAEIARLRARRGPLAARLQGLAALSAPPPAEAPAVLAGLAAGIERARAAVDAARGAGEAARGAEAACAARIRAALARAGNCPLCGQTLDAAAFLARFAGDAGPEEGR